jgi:hypothetical protein
MILCENMRQCCKTAEDDMFHKALANVQYKACTPSDISFLRSRVSSNIPGKSSINNIWFRNVSIITCLNALKDEIN